MTRENQSSGFPTRSDSNRPVQPQKMTRSLKFRYEEWGLCNPCCKTKALISCAITAQLICAFVFTLAKLWFSYDVAHMQLSKLKMAVFLINNKASLEQFKCNLFSKFFICSPFYIYLTSHTLTHTLTLIKTAYKISIFSRSALRTYTNNECPLVQ